MTDRLECDDCMAQAEDGIDEMATCKQVQRVGEIDAILKPELELEVCMQSQDYGAAARVGP